MQRFTQKYTLIQLLEDAPEGTEYDWRDWPLHVTLADVFATTWDVPTLTSNLSELLASRRQVTAVAGDDTYFGPEGQVKVTLLEMNPELIALHHDLVALLERGGVAFNDPQFTREGFVGHSTVQGAKRLHKGEQVTFDALTLIDMFPHDDPYRRKVLKTLRFGG